jgi:hypothetical protein
MWESNNDYDSHLPLLKACLDITEGGIIELGSGTYSTPRLRQYAAENGRHLRSFDSDFIWAEGQGAEFIEDWDSTERWVIPCGLVFIDEAPGEHRKISIEKYRGIADILVVHDTEPTADYVYGLSEILKTFKYRVDYKPEGKPWATALSDKIPLTEI